MKTSKLAIDTAASALGNDDNVAAVVSCGAVNPLLDILNVRGRDPIIDAIREKRKLLEAVTRALKSILSCTNTPKDDVFTVCIYFEKIDGGNHSFFFFAHCRKITSKISSRYLMQHPRFCVSIKATIPHQSHCRLE